MNDRDRIARVAILHDETRFRLYRTVRASREPVRREQAAKALRISPALAAFHLDKLLEAGLLECHMARPPGRSGPGAGRTAKYYRPADPDVSVSIPERRYDTAGLILTEAIRSARPRETRADSVLRIAKRRGRSAGKATKAGLAGLDRAERALAACGFEPMLADAETITLRNCPFRILALDDPDLVCGMNRAFVEGVLRGAGAHAAQAALTRDPGVCCVTVRDRVRPARS